MANSILLAICIIIMCSNISLALPFLPERWTYMHLFGNLAHPRLASKQPTQTSQSHRKTDLNTIINRIGTLATEQNIIPPQQSMSNNLNLNQKEHLPTPHVDVQSKPINNKNTAKSNSDFLKVSNLLDENNDFRFQKPSIPNQQSNLNERQDLEYHQRPNDFLSPEERKQDDELQAIGFGIPKPGQFSSSNFKYNTFEEQNDLKAKLREFSKLMAMKQKIPVRISEPQ